MQQTQADKQAARDGFKFVVIRHGQRIAYTTTLAEAKRECGKAGKVVAISGMRYAAKNPRRRGDPSTPRAFATLASARAFVSRNDLGGVFVVEGKGAVAKPYAVLDAGSAEDLLADDLGRADAHRLLSDLDRAGRYVVRLSDYRTPRGPTANPSSGAKQRARGTRSYGNPLQQWYLIDRYGDTIIGVGKFSSRESARKKANNMVARDVELTGMLLVSYSDLKKDGYFDTPSSLYNNPRKRRNPSFAKWLDTFLEEKEIDMEEVLTVKGKAWGTNYIPVGAVVRAMKMAPKHEQEAIKTMLVKIDFRNAPVRPYLAHLAQAIAH